MFLIIILVLVFLVAFVLSHIAKKRFPEKVNKIIPYNFMVLGGLFCYLSTKAINNVDELVLFGGIVFFVYGIFLLSKQARSLSE